MERKKHLNPVNQKYYVEKDFLLGFTLFLGGFKFQLLKYLFRLQKPFPMYSLNRQPECLA
jgi:hypothetical protein